MNSHLVVVAMSLAIAAVLVGCTGNETPIVESNSATPAPTSAPTPAGSLVTDCDDLVSAADQKKYAEAGWTFSDDFVQRMRDQQAHLVTFVDYGGALCQWGFPNSDASDVFAGSAITEAQQAEQRSYLEAQGFTLDRHNAADRYTLVTDDTYFAIYLFAGDYWFYGSDESAADRGRQFADAG